MKLHLWELDTESLRFEDGVVLDIESDAVTGRPLLKRLEAWTELTPEGYLHVPRFRVIGPSSLQAVRNYGRHIGAEAILLQDEQWSGRFRLLPIDETIKKEDGKWVVYSADGKKKFGSYTSLPAAKKRLRQIDFFKAIKPGS